jgi:hypothetical protein
VAGTKITVVSHSGGAKRRSTTPMTTESRRYITLAAATAPPALKRSAPPSSSSVLPTNVLAVMSAKATITYESASQMKIMKRSQARRPMCRFAISATLSASCRTLAMRDEKSCTAPMKITPNAIQRTHGSQPNNWPARMGPAIGPAAAIALKCWPKR